MTSKKTGKPNIVIIYADDLGFGDVGCYGADRIPTPHLDQLAHGGIKFTNGYSTAATCTPARYSLLTGSYPWRNSAAMVLPGDAPMVIERGTLTLPGMLQQNGYKTAVVGKWHLGLGEGNLDWNQQIERSPNDVGFDNSYIMAATNDRVPCVYVENGKVDKLDPEDPIEVRYCKENPFPGMPSGRENPELLRVQPSTSHDCAIVNGVSRNGYMRGGEKALWTDETMADVFLEKAESFLSANQDEPFFLYYAMHQPHVPRLPAPRFAGATPHGPRGDAIVEMDWCIGQILEKLEDLGVRENTIVIFSSDNGPVLDDGYLDQAIELNDDHKISGPLRGGKYSLYEGGTRVPFILNWPGMVEPAESDAIVCQVDFMASFADLLGHSLNDDDAVDSANVLEAFLGKSTHGRDLLVTEAPTAKTLIREGDWVMIPPHEGSMVCPVKKTERGNSPEPQLYNLKTDIGQQSNLAQQYPERVQEMERKLNTIRQRKGTRLDQMI